MYSMKFILNYPIVATLLFIISFEIIFQHNMFFLAYLALIYITLKTLGITNLIKKQSEASYKKLLRWIRQENKRVDVIFKNEYGMVEGNFYVKEQGDHYLIKATRDRKRKAVTIRINKTHGRRRQMVILHAPDFYITRNSVLKYLQENYFNQKED